MISISGNSSYMTLSELRLFFVTRIGDDYVCENFNADDYLSCCAQDRADIDDFIRETEDVCPKTLETILSKLSAPQTQWRNIMQGIAVQAARVFSAQKRVRPTYSSSTSEERLVQFLYREDPEWDECEVDEYLQGLNEDRESKRCPGWYLAVGSDSKDRSFFKKYIGQTKRTILVRTSEHRNCAAVLKRFLADGNELEDYLDSGRTQLFYFVWALKPTRTFKFIRLGQAHGDLGFGELEQSLWLNIVEHFFSLTFQTLQRGTLREYLGENALESVDFGLNVSLPILQSHWHLNRVIRLNFTCTIPEVVRFAKERMRLRVKSAQAKNKELNCAPSRENMRILNKKQSSSNWDTIAEVICNLSNQVPRSQPSTGDVDIVHLPDATFGMRVSTQQLTTFRWSLFPPSGDKQHNFPFFLVLVGALNSLETCTYFPKAWLTRFPIPEP
ncbi:hypothetical protein B0T24DRAFT_594549 [Lasiosphaeria ovina]|uniref:Uncharacterized protein n=1 Tax=Lasiosphaeria ovina TaxID=92902 RepID=A0AAE0N8T1_9PEZI|nr:hypothetical protein B0T24DRAFT_594549 [Lasiosphaeria ovina]